MLKASVISIVDDDESMRFATASLVRSLGWDARVFASAAAFLGSQDSLVTSCVISDVQMPDMTGVEMHEAMLKMGHATPVIFITAFPSERLRSRALANGAVAFLEKPVDPAVMARWLETLLGKP